MQCKTHFKVLKNLKVLEILETLETLETPFFLWKSLQALQRRTAFNICFRLLTCSQ